MVTGSRPFEQIAELRKQLEEARARLAVESETRRPEAGDLIQRLEIYLRDMKRDGYRVYSSGEPNRESTPFAHRTIESIEVIGLSDAARSDLLAQLPVQVGDTVTQASLERVGAAIRKFDEHLEWRVVPLEKGGASIRIHAPGNEK